MYAIFFGIYGVWFSFGSVCSLVLEDFAGDAFVAGGIDQIGWVSIVFNDLYGRDIQADGQPLLHTGKVFVG